MQSPPSSPVPVEVICLSGPAPLVGDGRIVSLNDGQYVINLDFDISRAEPGSRVILNFSDGTTPRVIAAVTTAEGNRLTCAQQQVRERERREFPRLVAGVPLRYRVVHGPDAIREIDLWLRGSDAPLERGEWQHPDELMNFSVTGLRFEADDCAQGDLLLVEFGLKGHEERWRGTARVRRIISVGINDTDLHNEGAAPGSRWVATSFEQIPSDAEAALTEMTLAIQDAML